MGFWCGMVGIREIEGLFRSFALSPLVIPAEAGTQAKNGLDYRVFGAITAGLGCCAAVPKSQKCQRVKKSPSTLTSRTARGLYLRCRCCHCSRCQSGRSKRWKPTPNTPWRSKTTAPQ